MKGRRSESTRASAARIPLRWQLAGDFDTGIACRSQNACISKTEMPNAERVGVCPSDDDVIH